MDIKKALLLCLLLIPSLVFAHGGRTAAYKELVLKTQSALNQLGYSAGQADGVLGNQTVKAIKHFQVDNEITVDGKPSYLLLEVLLGKVR
jgi:peptidoglycan hydrolase-like protein with peptidoglycan-binding domain